MYFQLLDAEVERPPARQLDHDRDPFDVDGIGSLRDDMATVESLPSPASPQPRPYLPRQRSTSFDNTKT